MGSTAGHGVHRGGNDEGAGLGNGFTQQINQGVTNAVVADASRGEQKFHDASPCRLNESRKAPPVSMFATNFVKLEQVYQRKRGLSKAIWEQVRTGDGCG